MSCTIVNTAPVIEQIKKLVNNNNTIALTAFSKAVKTMKDKKGKEYYVTTDEFKQYVYNVHNVVLDELSISNLNTFATYITDYYKNKIGDSALTAHQSDTNNQTRFGYSNVEARNYGKKTCATMILNFVNNLYTKGDSLNKYVAQLNKNTNGKNTKENVLKNYVITKLKDYIYNIVNGKNYNATFLDYNYDTSDINREEFLAKMPPIDEADANAVALRNRRVEIAYKKAVFDKSRKAHADAINIFFNNLVKLEQDITKSKNTNKTSLLNLLATFKETLANPNEYFKEVFLDSRINNIRLDVNDNEFKEIDTAEFIESAEEEDNQEIGEDKNTTIADANSHMGDIKNFMNHLSPQLVNYFNSLPKLRSTSNDNGNYLYDTDTYNLIPDTMSAAYCANIIYQYGNFLNKDTMISSIENIANNLAGAEGLIKFVNDLKNDIDFAYHTYRIFGKYIMSKLQTYHTNDGDICRQSNKNADKFNSILFELYNNAKATSILYNDYNTNNIIESFNNALDDVNKEKNGNRKRKIYTDICNKIYNELKVFYPSITEQAIRGYVFNGNDNIAIKSNLINILNILKETYKANKETYANYISRNAKIGEAFAKNKKQETRDIEEESLNPFYKRDNSKYIDMEKLYAVDYVSNNTFNTAYKLANMLLPYSTVKTELNSTNVNGNNSSDVLNNSMITNILSILKSKKATENFGKFKFQSRQYDFSNIMLEHKDDNGNIINYGLFTADGNGGFIPTAYAHRMLKIHLFDGATSEDGVNATYSQMSKADYITTAFVNYFNIEDYTDKYVYDDGAQIKFANYFMRTPSDAPKNFVLKLPRYDTTNLFNTNMSNETKTKIAKLLTDKSRWNFKDYSYFENLNAPISRTKDEFTNDITNKTKSLSIDAELAKNKKVNQQVEFTFETEVIDDKGAVTQMLYTLTGKLTKSGNKYRLVNPKRTALEDAGTPSGFYKEIGKLLQNNYIDYFTNTGEIGRDINTNHILFKQYKQMFMQELTDMANAINTFFIEHPQDNGKIPFKDGKPVFREGFANDKETASKLYKIYHTNGKAIYTESNGKFKFTGKVFTSDRFTLTELNADGSAKLDNNGKLIVRNYGQEIMDNAFDLFTGGDKYIHTIHTANGIQATLTAEQEAVVDKYIANYMSDLISNSIIRLNKFKKFIDKNLYTYENIADFVLNYRRTYIATNDIFEGDSKFYKDSQTILKRIKEDQGSGVLYGNVNYETNLNSERIENDNDMLAKTTFIKYNTDGTRENVNIKTANKFRGVTIVNTIRTGNSIGKFNFDKNGNVESFAEKGHLTLHLEQELINSGLTKSQAEAKAFDMMSGYANTIVNDAQSFITFEEWVRRIALRGQLKEYKPLIDAILDERKPIPVDVLDKFVQVQKNFYYDQYYNKDLNVFSPRQIKNAELVLVPRFIKGTQLETVYNIMKDKNIDQLNTEETSKAGNTNVLTLWDNDRNITSDSIEDFNNKAADAVELYSYNYLYTQSETPQHVDAMNKAGIQIMKKIIDNIPDKIPARDANGNVLLNDKKQPILQDNPLAKYKKELFESYVANIKHSFLDLMDEFGLATNDNGTLKLENGKISNLNVEYFFDKLKEEAARLGVSSNMMDYLTLNPNFETNDLSEAITNMPTFMSNVSTKLENIAQALFNNRITRQKLPGFHSAQITDVGWSKENIQTDTSLQYHPIKNGKVMPYAEVKVSPSYFGININNPKSKYYIGNYNSKEDCYNAVLKDLEAEGLDQFIGYRIPTEGKQSICIMKVKEFIDDAMGSTIVVPDDWVSQTGSDFDIDSVYGIMHNVRFDRSGTIRKIKYETEFTLKDYERYLDKHYKITADVNDKYSVTDDEKSHVYKNKDELIKKFIADLKRKQTNAFQLRKQLAETTLSDLYSKLNPFEQEDVRDSQAAFTKKYGKHHDVESYLDRLEYVINDLAEKGLNLSDEGKAYRNQLIDIYNDIADPDDTRKNEFADARREGISKIFDKLHNELINGYNQIAEDEGFMTYDEFMNRPKTAIDNTTSANNNKIVDSMIAILSNGASLEENLSRSNFDDLLNAKDSAENPIVKEVRKNRSPYDFLDQADYQEDVMSGAKLKAFSVTRDTFISVCNAVRPFIADTNCIYAKYSKAEYNEKELKESFDAVIDAGEYFIVKHNTIGWSNNNKNVIGKLLTAYSSQTTAHILDAVKAGAVPNVNDETFKVFKCFPDVGSDYKTACAFIMQPAIARINLKYNEANSIYASNKSNFFNTAVKEICLEIAKLSNMEVDEDINVDSLLSMINNKHINSLPDINKLSLNPNELAVPELGKFASIDADALNARLKQSNINDVNTLLFDLVVMLQYNKISQLANGISELARLTNPDKFGAKQSIFETSKIFDNINEMLIDSDVKFSTNPNYMPLLYVYDDGAPIHFLDKLYPGVKAPITDFIQNDNLNSPYPSLLAFLKYSTATSILINRNLFETQSPAFIENVMKIANIYADNKRTKVTPDLYKKFQNYILNDLYRNTRIIKTGINLDADNNIILDENINMDEEIKRIYGFDKASNFNVVISKENDETEEQEFTIEHKLHPTKTEILNYIKLSPAQKVLWIQQNYENPGIFGHYEANLYIQRGKKKGQQTLTYKEGNEDIETIYDLFDKAYNNDDLILKLAAIDVIKYAFVVEGFTMKHNGITATISNKPLMGETDFVSDVIENLRNLKMSDDIYENFVRSHSDSLGLPQYRIKKTEAGFNELSKQDDGIILLDVSDAPNFDANKNTPINSNGTTDLALKTKLYQNVNGIYKLSPYVNLMFDTKKGYELYKVAYSERLNKIIAYPLTKLEENENSEFSSNSENIKPAVKNRQYYKAIVNEFCNIEFSGNLSNLIAKYKTLKDSIKYQPATLAKNDKHYDLQNAILNPSEIEKKAVADIVNLCIQSYNNVDTVMVRNMFLRKYIKNDAASYTLNFNSNTIEKLSKFIDEDTLNAVKNESFVITKKPMATINYNYLSEKNFNTPIADNLNEQVKTLIVKARNNGIHKLNDVFTITPSRDTIAELTEYMHENTEDKDETYNSSVDEFNTYVTDIHKPVISFMEESMKALYRTRSTKNNKAVSDVLDEIKASGITTSADVTDNNLNFVLTKIYNYIALEANNILTDVDHFAENGDDYVNIANSHSIGLAVSDKTYKDKLLNLILAAKALVKNFEYIDNIDIVNSDDSVKKVLTNIKNKLDEIKRNTALNVAETKFAKAFAAKHSTNPTIQNHLIDVTDGYHSTSFLDMWINDMQETSNPLLQIITKEVMQDIKAKQYAADDRIKSLKATLAKYKSLMGGNINWEHIIKDGKFIQQYNDLFINDLRNHQEAVARAKAEHGKYSVEALKAQLEFDKWKLNHIHQKLVDDYYQQKIEIEERIINNAPEIFALYKQLTDERNKLNQTRQFGDLSAEDTIRYKDIEKQIKELRASYIPLENGATLRKLPNAKENITKDEIAERADTRKREAWITHDVIPNDDILYIETTNELRKEYAEKKEYYEKHNLNPSIYNVDAATELNKYIEASAKLYEFYLQSKPNLGFIEELNHNLNIIAKYEMRTADGVVTASLSLLENNEEYQKAKKWIEHNTTKSTPDYIAKEVAEAFKLLKEKNAKPNPVFVPDFNKNDIDSANKIIMKNADHTQELIKQPGYSDTMLLSCAANRNNIVFSRDFYDNMQSNGIRNSEYIKLVQKINSILQPYYNPNSKTINTADISETELAELKKLYSIISITNSKIPKSSTNGKRAFKFISENVDFIFDKKSFYEQITNARTKGPDYYRQWSAVNETVVDTIDENSPFKDKYIYDEVDKKYHLPNEKLYSFAVPKGFNIDKPDMNNKWVDKDKTKAFNILRKYTRKVPTSLYYACREKAYNTMSEDDFKKWHNAAHWFNPTTRTIEPIKEFMRTEYGDTKIQTKDKNGKIVYKDTTTWKPLFEYKPTLGNRTSEPRVGVIEKAGKKTDIDCRNRDFKDNTSIENNFKLRGKNLKGYLLQSKIEAETIEAKENGVSDADVVDTNLIEHEVTNKYKDNKNYYNNIVQTDEEAELMHYLQDIVKSFATTPSAKRFIDKGFAPASSVADTNNKTLYKAIASLFGWVDNTTGMDSFTPDEKVNFAYDKEQTVPMLSMLTDEVALSEIKKEDFTKDGVFDEISYNKAVFDKKEKIHKAKLDNNWEEIFESFIKTASRFNAIQENKALLFYAKDMINKTDVLVKNTGFKSFIGNKSKFTNKTTYVREKNHNLEKQFTNWIRRLVFEEYKEPHAKLNRIAGILQNYTSAKYMMFNVTGGIANVTVGGTGILAEAAAKDYFGLKNWGKANGMYATNVGSFFRDAYSDTATTFASGLTKYFNIVEFDKLIEGAPDTVAVEAIKKAKDLAFSPQSMGEHKMQNTTLFAMLDSHHIIETNGELQVMNFAEYSRNSHERALMNVIKDNDALKKAFEVFRSIELEDENSKKEYAWFRKDLTTEFVNIYLNNELKRKFVRERNEIDRNLEQEFNSTPNLMSQFDLINGKIEIKSDSILAKNKDKAYKLIGGFTNKVISVNKKIHGIYDTLGAAMLEKNWWGSLAMQYHKHLYPGFMKRYRKQGYYNEERHTIEKGCYTSIVDFIKMPLNEQQYIKKLKERGLDDDNIKILQETQSIFKSYFNFLMNLRLQLAIMPEYEIANIRRSLGGIAGVLGSICLGIAAKCFLEDDDESFVGNLMLHEADRLSTEAVMYNPIGAYLEAKKLWSSPLAATSTIGDIIHAMGMIAEYCKNGDDYNWYYTTGAFKGEHKLAVMAKRSTPVYHGVYTLQRLQYNNSYYKLGTNMLGFLDIK